MVRRMKKTMRRKKMTTMMIIEELELNQEIAVKVQVKQPALLARAKAPTLMPLNLYTILSNGAQEMDQDLKASINIKTAAFEGVSTTL
jgi:hypothetical protein